MKAANEKVKDKEESKEKAGQVECKVNLCPFMYHQMDNWLFRVFLSFISCLFKALIDICTDQEISFPVPNRLYDE